MSCLATAALAASGSLDSQHRSRHACRSQPASINRPTRLHRSRRRHLAAASSSGNSWSDEDLGVSGDAPLGVIIECDGALLDAHLEGHRVAFNRAFSEIGHDCTSWTPAVYYDLMRLGNGTGEGLIAAYYQIAGWPMMLASSERNEFLKKVHAIKVRILREMTAKGEVPLRQGVAQFLDDALADHAKVAVVAATASVPEDGLVSSAMFNLGPNRAFQLRVVSMGAGTGAVAFGGEGPEGAAAPPASDSEEEEGDALPGATFEQQVAAAQARAKKQAAREFVRVYNLQKAYGSGLQVDPKIMAAAERAGLITPQFLAALAATLGVSHTSTMVIGGGHTILEAGKTAGMLSLAVPPSVALRGGFAAAEAVFDGYGAGGGLTWRKAKILLAKKQRQAGGA